MSNIQKKHFNPIITMKLGWNGNDLLEDASVNNLFGTLGYLDWVTAEENWESCSIVIPSKRCFGKRRL